MTFVLSVFLSDKKRSKRSMLPIDLQYHSLDNSLSMLDRAGFGGHLQHMVVHHEMVQYMFYVSL